MCYFWNWISWNPWAELPVCRASQDLPWTSTCSALQITADRRPVRLGEILDWVRCPFHMLAKYLCFLWVWSLPLCILVCFLVSAVPVLSHISAASHPAIYSSSLLRLASSDHPSRSSPLSLFYPITWLYIFYNIYHYLKIMSVGHLHVFFYLSLTRI